MTIFPQGELVRVQTAKQDLHDLDEILLQVLPVTVDEVAKRLQYVLLVLVAWAERRRVELDQLEELLSEAHSDFKERLRCHQFEVELRVGRPDQIEVFRGHPRNEKLPVERRLVVVEDEEEEAHDVLHDRLPLEVRRRRLEVALEQIEKNS